MRDRQQQLGCLAIFMIFAVVALVATQFGYGPSDADAATVKTKRCASVVDPTPARVTARGVTCKTAKRVAGDAIGGAQEGDRTFEIFPQRRSWTCRVSTSSTITCRRYRHLVTVKPR